MVRAIHPVHPVYSYQVKAMLSIELIRRDPEFVRAALATRGEVGPLEEVLALDARRRQAISQGDELRARRNQASRAIGQLRSQGQAAPDDVVREMREVGQEIDALEQENQIPGGTHTVDTTGTAQPAPR